MQHPFVPAFLYRRKQKDAGGAEAQALMSLPFDTSLEGKKIFIRVGATENVEKLQMLRTRADS